MLATIAVSTALILGFFGRLHPAFDTFAHLRAHFAAALAACAVLLVLVRYRLHALVAILLAAGAFVTTLPSQRFGAASAAQTATDPSWPVYRLLQINLRYDNPEPNRVLSLIGKVRPDIITVDEVSEMWAEKLASLKADYPYQAICDVAHLGLAVLSRRPIVDGGANVCLDRGTLAVTTVDLGGRHVDIAALHLLWPWPVRQSPQIDRLGAPLGALSESAILAGDFNATTWSNAIRRVGESGGLTLVGGIGPTWMAYGFPRAMRWAGLPIDHVMVKGDVVPIAARVLDDVGSDHWPVLLEFSLKPAGQEQATATLLR